MLSIARRSRRSLLTSGTYNSELNAGADVFVTTVGAAAFEAAIPPFLRMMDEGFVPLPEVSTEWRRREERRRRGSRESKNIDIVLL